MILFALSKSKYKVYHSHDVSYSRIIEVYYAQE